MHVAIDPCLGRRRPIGSDETGVAVRQVEREEMRFLLDAANDHHGLAKIRLGMADGVRQWHEQLTAAQLSLPHVSSTLLNNPGVVDT